MNQRRLFPTQIAEIMSRLASLNGLQTQTLHRLAQGARLCSIARNETLFAKGDTAQDLYIVVSGKIKVSIPLSHQAEKLMSLVGPGECLGVASVYLGEPHPAQAVAKVDSHLLAVEREVLLRQANLDAGLACRLLGAASRHKLALLQDMESCMLRSSLERLSCYLLQHRPHPRAHSYEVVLPSTKREIAAKLNMAPETLSRLFHQLAEEGAIEIRGRLIHVRDSAKLAAHNLAGSPDQAEIKAERFVRSARAPYDSNT